MLNWKFLFILMFLTSSCLMASTWNHPHGLLIRINPKGEKILFETIQQKVLQHLDQHPLKDHEDQILIESSESYALNDMISDNAEMSALIEQVRAFISDWLSGLQINPIKPHVTINNLNSSLVIKDLKLQVQRPFSKNQNELILNIQALIEDLKIDSQLVRLQDLNNPFIKNIDFKNPHLTLNEDSQFILNIPIKIHITHLSQLNLILNNNYQHELKPELLNLDWEQLSIPTIELQIGRSIYSLESDRLNKGLKEIKPRILDYLIQITTENLSSILNPFLYDMTASLNYLLKQTLIPPMGPESLSPEEQLILHIKPQKYIHTPYFGIDFNLTLRDPQLPFWPAQPPSYYLPEETMRFLPNEHFGFGLHISVIQSLLDASFLRGYFKDIPYEKSFLSLNAAPVLTTPDSSLNPSELYFKTHLQIKYPTPPGLSRLLINKTISFSIEAQLRLVKSQDSKSLLVQLVSFDEKSLQVNTRDLTFIGGVFEKIVIQSIQNILKEASEKYQKKPLALGEPLQLPTQPYLETQWTRFETHLSGYLIFYLKAK